MSRVASSYESYSGEGRNECRWLRFEYENCWCRQRASLKIVADARRESYGMLYFVCEKKCKVGGCNFFRWCHPKSTERDSVGQIRGEDDVDEVESQSCVDRKCGAAVGAGWKGKEFFLVCVACCSLVVAIVAMFISLVN